MIPNDIVAVIIGLLQDSRAFGRTCRQFYEVFKVSDGIFWLGRRHPRVVPVKIAPLMPYTMKDYVAAGNMAVVMAREMPLLRSEWHAAVSHDQVDMLKLMIEDVRKITSLDHHANKYNPISFFLDLCDEYDSVECYKYLREHFPDTEHVLGDYVSKISTYAIGAGLSEKHTRPQIPDTWDNMLLYEKYPYWDLIDFSDEPIWRVLVFVDPGIVAYALRYGVNIPTFDADFAKKMLSVMIDHRHEHRYFAFLIYAKNMVDLSAMAPVFAAAGFPKIARICRKST